jgi:hypothetical protein
MKFLRFLVTGEEADGLWRWKRRMRTDTEKMGHVIRHMVVCFGPLEMLRASFVPSHNLLSQSVASYKSIA